MTYRDRLRAPLPIMDQRGTQFTPRGFWLGLLAKPGGVWRAQGAARCGAMVPLDVSWGRAADKVECAARVGDDADRRFFADPDPVPAVEEPAWGLDLAPSPTPEGSPTGNGA